VVLRTWVEKYVAKSTLGWPVRVARVLAGWATISIGIAFMIQARVGVAPIDSLIKGLADRTHWNFGLVFIGVAVAFYTIGWVLGSPPGPASVIGSFVIGPAINAATHIINQPSALIIRLGYYAVGLVLVATGICLIITTDLGAGPSEVLMLGLHRKGISLLSSRWIVDAAHLAMAFALRGPIGIGTAIFLVAMGPLIRFGLRQLGFVPPVVAPPGVRPLPTR
jgi:uncharacterized membrane protein YczE